MSDNLQIIQTLHKLVPSSKGIVPDRFRLTADNVFKSLDVEGVVFNIKRLSIGDWDLESATLTDKEIFERMSINEAGHKGRRGTSVTYLHIGSFVLITKNATRSPHRCARRVASYYYPRY